MAEPELTRLPNERRILTLLRIHGSMTRADMARRLSLTPATLTNIVDALMKRDLVVERRNDERRAERELGRPGVHVALNQTGVFFLGVEVGVGIIRFALLNLALDVVAQGAQVIPDDVSPEQAVAAVAALASRLQRRAEYWNRIHATVLTVPGLVRDDGFVVHLPILGWRDVNVQRLAQDALDLPVTVENNANAAAFGEVYTRPDLLRDCVVYLKLGTGCGGAVILNGRLIGGAFGVAAELGHLRVGSSGPRCSCGQVGCLEPNVNLGALARLLDADVERGPAARLLPAQAAALAMSGDPDATKAVESIARHLALGVTTLVNIFNPRTVLLGGPMRPVIEAGLQALTTQVTRGIVPGMMVPALELSRLGDMECAIGAATIAHHRAVDISHLDVEALS